MQRGINASSPSVSVVVACRNAAATIGETLASLRAQSYAQLEIIVVDDGSTDQTCAVVNAGGDTRVLLLTQAAIGAQAARNLGIAASSGELIQFLDADDLLHPDKIASQVSRYQRLGPTYLYLGAYSTFTRVPDPALQKPTAMWTDMDAVSWLSSSWSGRGMVPPHAWLVPRPLLRGGGFWDERLLQNQDGEFFTRLLLKSQGVRFCAQSICYYRVGQAGSLSNSSSPVARDSLFLSVQLSSQHLLLRENSRRTRQACAVLFMDVAARASRGCPALSRLALKRARELQAPLRTTERGRLTHWLAAAVGWGLVLRMQPLLRALKTLTQRFNAQLH